MNKQQDNRRENLRRWVDRHGVPQKEKSYFSQLLGGSSFGERSARRLERDYRMGDGYLDQSLNDSQQALKLVHDETNQHASDPITDADEIIELLALYQQANRRERENILDLARSIEKRNALRWTRSEDN